MKFYEISVSVKRLFTLKARDFALFKNTLSRNEVQRDAIIAIAQACRARAVFKDMALMPAAARAVIFCARHK